MTYEDFIRGIGFRDIDPLAAELALTFKVKSKTELQRAQQAFSQLDVHIARLPELQKEYEALLKPLLGMPRLSTFANAAIIARSIEEMEPGTSYVNVGIWHGFSLLVGMLAGRDRAVVGVDNFSQFGGPKEAAFARFQKHRAAGHSLYDMDYREYFLKMHRGAIGFYFYDGHHAYEHQLEGLRVAEPYFSPRCIVMVDDTNWPDPRQATLDFVAQSRNRYELLLDRKTGFDGHPTFWNGVMILQRRG